MYNEIKYNLINEWVLPSVLTVQYKSKIPLILHRALKFVKCFKMKEFIIEVNAIHLN